MATYLFAYNPKSWDWVDLPQESAMVKAGASLVGRWSCGHSRRPGVGDRAFLIRLGVEPRGIFGSGLIVSEAYEDEHWNDARAALGDTAFYVEIDFDTLLVPGSDEILARQELLASRFGAMRWDTQSSGVRIPEAVAADLEVAWTPYAAASAQRPPDEIQAPSDVREGAKMTVVVNAYERSANARRRCIGHYGTRCSACGIDLVEVYGELATNLVHVHHLIPLAQIGHEYRLDPIKDLRPVCPNCHAVIHHHQPALTIETLKATLLAERPAKAR